MTEHATPESTNPQETALNDALSRAAVALTPLIMESLEYQHAATTDAAMQFRRLQNALQGRDILKDFTHQVKIITNGDRRLLVAANHHAYQLFCEQVTGQRPDISTDEVFAPNLTKLYQYLHTVGKSDQLASFLNLALPAALTVHALHPHPNSTNIHQHVISTREAPNMLYSPLPLNHPARMN